MEQYYDLQLAPSGQLYSGGLNVTCHYEIMQYTGLKDENGKEIYEGDIVEAGKSKGLIVWGHDGFIIYLKQNIDCWNNNLWYHARYIKIIGNLYENPELIEKS